MGLALPTDVSNGGSWKRLTIFGFALDGIRTDCAKLSQ
jgi:hypothetical protein